MTDEPMDDDRTNIPALDALDVRAPDALRHAVERQVAAAREGRARVSPFGARPLALAFGGGLAALVVVLALVLGGSGSTSGPTVQEASRVALLPASAPAPPARADGELLQASVEGIAYPTWTRAGWWAVGERSDTLAGRRIRTVLYSDRRGGRVGYAIAAGDVLPVEGGQVVERHGARLRVLVLDGAAVVTWRRDGHTCILASREVSPARLLTLASYAT